MSQEVATLSDRLSKIERSESGEETSMGLLSAISDTGHVRLSAVPV